MKFTIPCETFCRMANILSFFEPRTTDETRHQIECVRIEHYKGKIFTIATNQQIAAMEYVGETSEPDGVAHVANDSDLIRQCETEKMYKSFLEIVTIPEIALGTAKTMMGYTHPKNACIWPDITVMDKWREWASETAPTKSKGALYMETAHMITLFNASPSGCIVFPEIIDVNVPVVLRDKKNANWVGLFLGKPLPTEQKAQPATLPEWWAK